MRHENGVLVVDAGPIGLTAAYLLGRYGMPCILVAAEAVGADGSRSIVRQAVGIGFELAALLPNGRIEDVARSPAATAASLPRFLGSA